MAQSTNFPLRKPPGFHYDFFLLGITTFIAGLLGIPAPNGLIPQAPIHTTSLLVMGPPSKKYTYDIEHQQVKAQMTEKRHDPPEHAVADEDDVGMTPVARSRSRRFSSTHLPCVQEQLEPDPTQAKDGEGEMRQHEIPVAVVEQRVSNLAQGALCLVLLSRPFLHVLGLIPRGVLAGLLYVLFNIDNIDKEDLHTILIRSNPSVGTWVWMLCKAMELLASCFTSSSIDT